MGRVIYLVAEVTSIWRSLGPGCWLFRSSAEQSEWVKGTHEVPPSACLTVSVPQVWGCARFSRLLSCVQFPKFKLGDGVTPLSCPKFQSCSAISLTILKADILHPILLLFSSKWIQNLEELGCFPGGQGFWRKDGQLISHGKKNCKKVKWTEGCHNLSKWEKMKAWIEGWRQEVISDLFDSWTHVLNTLLFGLL